MSASFSPAEHATHQHNGVCVACVCMHWQGALEAAAPSTCMCTAGCCAAEQGAGQAGGDQQAGTCPLPACHGPLCLLWTLCSSCCAIKAAGAASTNAAAEATCTMQPCLSAAFDTYSTIATTGRTFIYNNLPMDQSSGQLFCNQKGGHLATYNSSFEQREVEQYFIQEGLLLPNFHKYYWLGYTSDGSNWPLFRPYDGSVLPLTDPKAYNHFGLMRFTNASIAARPEPNNFNGGEFCTVGNMSQTYVGAWGWSDTGCGGQNVVICMAQSE